MEIEYRVRYDKKLQSIGLVEIPRTCRFLLDKDVVALIYNVTEGNVFYHNKEFDREPRFSTVRGEISEIVNDIFIQKIINDPPSAEEEKTYVITLNDIKQYEERLKNIYIETLKSITYNDVYKTIEDDLYRFSKELKVHKTRNKFFDLVRGKLKELVNTYVNDVEKIKSEIYQFIPSILNQVKQDDREEYIKELEKTIEELKDELSRKQKRIQELEEKIEELEKKIEEEEE